ncbi:MAG: SpoIIE family protein phosphatase [Desulfofustis sp.]|nr:SpoIIE family protein phosphatase [Desulfofustis sp.]
MPTNFEIALTGLGLTELESEALAEKTKTHSLPCKTIVLEKGNPSDALYLVLEGRAKAIDIDANGKERVVTYFDPGDHFGWTGLGEGLLHTSIMTAEPSRFLVLPKNELKSITFESYPSKKRVSENFLKKTALKSLKLHEVVQQKTAISEILHAISNSPTDVQSILETVAENAARLCEASDAEIFQTEGDGLRLVAKYGSHPLWPIGTLRPIRRDWVAGRSVVDRLPIHVNDLQDAKADFPLGAVLAKQFGHRTTFATPLLRQGIAIGVIIIRRMVIDPLTDNQISLIETFADEAAIAIENVRLFNELQEKKLKVEEQAKELAEWNKKLETRVAEQAKELTEWNAELESRVAAQVAQLERLSKLEYELTVASEIQMSMLPGTIPRLAGYEFSATMLPAKSVGGDFFDFIPLGENLLGIAVGDVSDKGVPAALFMAMVRSLLRAEAHPGRTVTKVLRSVNLHLMDMNENGMFVTVLFGVLNVITHQFQYVRAGHEVPIYFDQHGSVRRLPQAGGQALGIFKEIILEEQSIELSKGSTLLLCSDGITDALNQQNVNFGYDGIADAVGGVLDSSATVICETLVKAVKDHQSGLQQYDDMTVVVMQSI